MFECRRQQRLNRRRPSKRQRVIAIRIQVDMFVEQFFAGNALGTGGAESLGGVAQSHGLACKPAASSPDGVVDSRIGAERQGVVTCGLQKMPSRGRCVGQVQERGCQLKLHFGG